MSTVLDYALYSIITCYETRNLLITVRDIVQKIHLPTVYILYTQCIAGIHIVHTVYCTHHECSHSQVKLRMWDEELKCWVRGVSDFFQHLNTFSLVRETLS